MRYQQTSAQFALHKTVQNERRQHAIQLIFPIF